MNIVTFDKAYSLFPRATFEERVSLVLLDVLRVEGKAFEKYSRRGWAMIPRIWPGYPELDRCFALGRSRSVGDSLSWVVPLDTAGVVPRPRLSPSSPEFGWDPVECSSWKLDASTAQRNGVCVFGTAFWSRSLRFEYLVLDERLHRTLVDFFSDQTVLQGFKDASDPSVWTW